MFYEKLQDYGEDLLFKGDERRKEEIKPKHSLRMLIPNQVRFV